MPNGARNWCFTLNNPNNDERTNLGSLYDSASPLIHFLIVGREVGASGTPHLQCFVQFDRQVSLARCRRLISPRAHYEIARGTSLEASNYCRKDGDFDEYGQLVAGQGKRNDWEDLRTFVVGRGAVPSNRDLASNFPGLFSRSAKLREICASFLPAPTLVDGDPRDGWQASICERVVDPCDDSRKIYFYVDFVGNRGKSWLCAYLISKYPERVQVLSVGKRDDLAHVIDETKDIFLFDCPRGSMQFLQYSILEKLKDRMIFSPKYCSTVKILSRVPHVVVFCNEEPDRTTMSEDRWNVTIIGN